MEWGAVCESLKLFKTTVQSVIKQENILERSFFLRREGGGGGGGGGGLKKM